MSNQPVNLNNLRIEKGPYLQDYSATSSDGMVEVYFRNIENRLISHIREAETVLGCVAWLTNKDILTQLANKLCVSIIVQKEDFLRPDIETNNNWQKHLRSLYASIPGPHRFDFDTIMRELSTSSEWELEAIRCVGNYNRDKTPAFPRSHHKFIILCKLERTPIMMGNTLCEDRKIKPYAVWTGSFNFTKTAGRSLENAVLLRHPEIIQAYYEEYSQVAALSEPLDWESDWVAPEWRLGT